MREDSCANHRRVIMKIMLQDLQSKRFFQYSRRWTSNPAAAFDFRTSKEVLAFVEREALRDVQLVVQLENPKCYEVVPLQLAKA